MRKVPEFIDVKRLVAFVYSRLDFRGTFALQGLSCGLYEYTNTICPPKVGSIDLKRRSRTTEKSACHRFGMKTTDGIQSHVDRGVEGLCSVKVQKYCSRSEGSTSLQNAGWPTG